MWRGAYEASWAAGMFQRKHLSIAAGKTVDLVGVLEKITTKFGRSQWWPQMEGPLKPPRIAGHRSTRSSRLQLFGKDAEEAWTLDEKSTTAACSANPELLGDCLCQRRSAVSTITEPPDSQPYWPRSSGRSGTRVSPIHPHQPPRLNRKGHNPMKFLISNDAGPQMGSDGELIARRHLCNVMMKAPPRRANGAMK